MFEFEVAELFFIDRKIIQSPLSLHLSTFKIINVSTIAISLIIVLFVILFLIGFSYINHKQKRNVAASLLAQLGKSAAENNLSFSNHELLNGCILGLDALSMKLLILQQYDEDTYECNIIDLQTVKNCSLTKRYKPFYQGNSKQKKIENFLDKIALHIEFTGYKEPGEVIFYKHITNNIFEIQELEHKANKWKSLLLEITANKLKKDCVRY